MGNLWANDAPCRPTAAFPWLSYVDFPANLINGFVNDEKLSNICRIAIMNQDEITLPDGSKYIGELKDGKPHGQGVVIHPNGAQYTGNFADG